MLSAARPVLFTCSQRVALHVHTSRLLRRRTDSAGHYDVSVSALESDQMSVVSGMKEMQVEEPLVAPTPSAQASGQPKTCSAAVALGLQSFEAGKYEVAIEEFTKALELPGNGAMRMAGSPKEYACPSEGEEQAAMYNMACCYAKLDEVDSGLTCLAGLLEAGFEDYDTLRTDPDLEGLRMGADFEALLGQFDSVQGRLLGRGKRKPTSKKGWLSRW